ncbi:MAG: Gfo/Idh/MocA family oxidoreductase [Oligoflexia bacterium]|nr:Gfo/Idh/MocA family oxidoreductase [Oligoflexia bacterium]
MKNSKIAVALIGFGHLGRFHAQKVAQAGAELVCIIEPNQNRKEIASVEFPQAKIFNSLEEVEAEGEGFDAAIIAAPTSQHFSLIKELFKNDKHIFCEKPICSSQEEIAELEEILATTNANKKNLVLQVGHSERFHQAFEILREISGGQAITLSAGSSIVINRLAPYKPRALDVDVVQDLMIHDIDLLLYLFKEMPTKITVPTAHKFVSNYFDYVVADFEFASGRHARLRAHRDYPKTLRELEIINSSGSYLVDLFQNEIHYTEREKREGEVKKISYQKRDHLLLQQKHFYNSIINHANHTSKSIVPFEEGIAALKIAHMVLSSCRCL